MSPVTKIIFCFMLKKVSCRFSGRGCNYKAKREILLSHEVVCDKSRVKCSKIVFACEEYVDLLKLTEHIKSRHKCTTITGSVVKGVELWDSENSEGLCSWNYHHLEFDGNDFFTKLVYKGNMVYFWTYLVGLEEEAKNYGFVISLGSPSKNSDELIYKGGQVCSLFTSTDSLLDGTSESCVLALSRSTVKNLLTVNSNGRFVLDYKYEITKKVNCL